MNRTNATVTFKTVTTDWQGNETSTVIGSHDVFVEHYTKFGWTFTREREPDIIQRGYIYLYDDVSLKEGDIVEVDGKDYTIVSIDRYSTGSGKFHHIELGYR